MPDQALKRQYLEAMGIQTWSLRAQAGTQSERPPPEVSPELASCSGSESASSAMGAVASTPMAGPVEGLEWGDLETRVLTCRACGLHETRTQAVFGIGDRDADLMVIGEAPGADEDRQGKPFVGRAGQLLNAMLFAIGLRREQVFIANVLKCRPPGNRDPRPEETAHCEPFLLRQVELVRPKVILAVGRISAQNLLRTSDTVGRLRGRVHAFGSHGIPLVVTYHPAYLLRSPDQKPKAWLDLQRVIQLLDCGSIGA